ncbi:MAG: WecB/TagA/CpsF family glycosyltransferase [Rhizobiales bacterium]|nr:WecB/TagA/CpsF family glycosyltransferase [Hyphomicrobiales bacterium]
MINVATLAQAVDAAVGRAEEKRGFRLFTLNLDHLVKRRHDRAFSEAYGQADFVSADGAPVAVLARRQGAEVERTTGADLVEPLCREAAKRDIPIAFFGSNAETLEKTAQSLRLRIPGLTICHLEAPPYGFDPTSPDAEAAARRIADSGARIVLVALGAPKQELFASHVARIAPDLGFVCIGAALDFIAGTQARAPLVFQKAGIEWVWRLASNPVRMARRYWLCALVLIRIVAAGAYGRHPILRT